MTPSGTKIAHRAGDLAELSEVPSERLEPVLARLAGEARILRPVGDDAYEIYHDALAGPILDWRARWQERQRRRRLVSLVALFGSAAAVFGVIAVLAIIFFFDAQHQRDVSRSRELAAAANLQLAADPQEGLHLAMQAFDAASTPQAEEALRGALTEVNLRATLRGHDLGVQDAIFSPDGKLILTASNERARAVVGAAWDATRLMDGHSDDVTSTAFSPDGRLIVSRSYDETAVGVVHANEKAARCPG